MYFDKQANIQGVKNSMHSISETIELKGAKFRILLVKKNQNFLITTRDIR